LVAFQLDLCFLKDEKKIYGFMKGGNVKKVMYREKSDKLEFFKGRNWNKN